MFVEIVCIYWCLQTVYRNRNSSIPVYPICYDPGQIHRIWKLTLMCIGPTWKLLLPHQTLTYPMYVFDLVSFFYILCDCLGSYVDKYVVFVSCLISWTSAAIHVIYNGITYLSAIIFSTSDNEKDFQLLVYVRRVCFWWDLTLPSTFICLFHDRYLYARWC